MSTLQQNNLVTMPIPTIMTEPQVQPPFLEIAEKVIEMGGHVANHPGIAHLKRIFEPGDTVHISLQRSTRSYPNGGLEEEHWSGPLKDFATPETMEELQIKNNDGWNIYRASNPLKTGQERRLKLNAAVDSLRSVFIEFDTNVEASMTKLREAIDWRDIPEPHIVVESSCSSAEGPKRQVIWCVDSTSFDVHKVEGLNKAMAAMFGGDEISVDVLRLLRLPGFRNMKEKYGPDFPMVKTVEEYNVFDERYKDRYSYEDFKLDVTPVTQRAVGEKIADALIQFKIDALEDSAIDLGLTKPHAYWKDWTAKNGAHSYLLDMNCVWGENHSDGNLGGASLKVFDSGAVDYSCLHEHAHDGKLNWAAYKSKYKELTGKEINVMSPEEHNASMLKNAPRMNGVPAGISLAGGDTPPVSGAAATAEAAPSRVLSFVRGSDCKPERLRWLWRGRILADKLNVFSGEPDMGKGLATIDLAARITRHLDFPDCMNELNGPKDVLFLSSEDDRDDTIVPRLIVAGADMSRIHFAEISDNATGTKEEGIVCLDRDLPPLEAMCKQHPDIVLIIPDPVIAFLGDADPNKDKEVRPIYSKMKAFAKRLGVAWLYVNHWNKNEFASSINRTSGAKTMVSAPRATWMFSKDPNDATRYLMTKGKGNLSGGRTKNLAYQLVGEVLDLGDGQPADPDGVGKLVWAGETDQTCDEVLKDLADPTRKDKNKAEKLLEELLANGPVLSHVVYTRAEDVGLSADQIKRARYALKYPKPVRIGESWHMAKTQEELDDLRTHCFKPGIVLGNGAILSKTTRQEEF